MHYLYILFLSTLFVSCSSVPKEYSVNNAICHYDDPIFNISNQELTINPFFLKELKTRDKDTILVNNGHFKNEFRYSKDEYITNQQTNRQLGIAKYIRYNHKGNIKWVEFKYLNGYKNIFKELDVNKQGEITEVMDYEKGYTICWAEAIEIVKKAAKKVIKKYEVTGFNLSHNNLNKFPNAKPEWQITLDGNEIYKLKDIDVYRIDGVTGKFLRKTKIIMTHEY